MPAIILLRGLPGSGKTTLARLLSENGKYPVTSIDSYFTDSDTDEYIFNYKDNHLAYKHCEDQTRSFASKGVEKVFVDNTFTLEWEMEPYFKIAKEFNCKVFVLTVENRHNGKNTHNVSDEQVKKMAEKYKVILM